MLPGSYRAQAPAKVNLGLAILTRRGDGFHEVETLMAAIDLADEVRLTVGPAPAPLAGQASAPGQDEGAAPAPAQVAGAAPAPIALTVESGELPSASQGAVDAGPDNLAYRAASAYLAARAGADPQSVSIELIKRVPVAAGLGGGSSDAAAVLRLLAQAEAPGEGPGPEELAAIALGLGSDVPFFLSGQPAAVARGRGERLSGAPLPPLHLVLVNPGLQLSAAAAYADLVGFTPRLRAERAAARLAEGLDPGWSNGLQPGVLRAHPEVREVLGALRAAGLKGVLMSGSGPTCFGLAGSGAEAEEVAERLAAEQPAWWTAAVRTATQGAA